MTYSNEEMSNWTEEQWYAYFHAGRVAASQALTEHSNGHVWARDEDGLVEHEYWGNHDGPRCTVCDRRFCRNCHDPFPPCGVSAPESDDRNTGRDLLDVATKRIQRATVGDIIKSKKRG